MTPFITACHTGTITDIIRMRDKGLSQSNIAVRQAISLGTLRRYIRVYDLYGIEAFVGPTKPKPRPKVKKVEEPFDILRGLSFTKE